MVWSGSVSRILFRLSFTHARSRAGDGYSSRRRIAPRARATYPEVVAQTAEAAALWTGNPDDASLFGLAPRRVCLATECYHPMLVGSYPTVSPITCAPRSHRLVYFLLHLSSGRPAWPLASSLPCGVRTFLSRSGLSQISNLKFEFFGAPATARPTPKNR